MQDAHTLNEDQFFIFSMFLLDGDDSISVSKYVKRATQIDAVQLLHDLVIPNEEFKITEENRYECYAKLSHYIMRDTMSTGTEIDIASGLGQKQYQAWKANRRK